MKKSIRTLALMTIFLLAVQPVFADGGGGTQSPFPRADSSLSWSFIAYTVLSICGF